jgi:hypothetical protein
MRELWCGRVCVDGWVGVGVGVGVGWVWLLGVERHILLELVGRESCY